MLGLSHSRRFTWSWAIGANIGNILGERSLRAAHAVAPYRIRVVQRASAKANAFHRIRKWHRMSCVLGQRLLKLGRRLVDMLA